eukprot:3856582-Prymnesium_polylepis.1
MCGLRAVALCGAPPPGQLPSVHAARVASGRVSRPRGLRLPCMDAGREALRRTIAVAHRVALLDRKLPRTTRRRPLTLAPATTALATASLASPARDSPVAAAPVVTAAIGPAA